jgi:UDP-2,3-diacylglucosamine pyrophosphatase LpxH
MPDLQFIEDDKQFAASEYPHRLTYMFDESLPGKGGFRYSFDAGGLKCSELPAKQTQTCIVSPTKMSVLQHETPAFVYLDNGCWVDNADGNGAKRRDFALVCGPHVYLCEYGTNSTPNSSKVEAVNSFFSQLKKNGHGIQVLQYLHAFDTVPSTVGDPNLYLFLGDLHLPPVSWFYSDIALGVFSEVRNPPSWLANTPVFKHQNNARMRNYYSISECAREHNSVPKPLGTNADIYGNAEVDLVAFIDGIISLPAAIKSQIHFIQTGDLFELWLGRSYQYKPSVHGEPVFESDNSPNLIADWCLEVMIQNARLFEALHRLERCGLREVKYLWGNHDAYLKEKVITRLLDIPDRDPIYIGLNNDLHAEHGHRFDCQNHDNTAYWFEGPMGAELAYSLPVLRSAEKPYRTISSLLSRSNERDLYLEGASLIFLAEKYDLKKPPFAIFAMGHTHDRKLFKFKIKAEYSAYG